MTTRPVLPDLYEQLRAWLREDERVMVHQEEVGDRLMGVVAGTSTGAASSLRAPKQWRSWRGSFGRQMALRGASWWRWCPRSQTQGRSPRTTGA